MILVREGKYPELMMREGWVSGSPESVVREGVSRVNGEGIREW